MNDLDYLSPFQRKKAMRDRMIVNMFNEIREEHPELSVWRAITVLADRLELSVTPVRNALKRQGLI